ncbi:MAG: class II glutamine amidotransferase [Myxococcales bacterium]|nr:class II glutamine amidotransferase [Myxococcales bacterium]
MCRVLAYHGTPVALDHLLFEPDNSLVTQSYAPQMLGMLNLAGFGMVAWDPTSFEPERPFVYRTTQLPFFDRNLRALSAKVRARCLLAHVRGVAYSHRAVVSEQNVHPFQLPGTQLSLAHNGDLAQLSLMKQDLLEHISPPIAGAIAGTTDSEMILALLASQLRDPARIESAEELVGAIDATLRVIRRVRERHGIQQSSSVNLFVSDGHHMVATRFGFDFGRYEGAPHPANVTFLSLWYTTGRDYGLHGDEWKMVGGPARADSVIMASEPLTRDVSTWIEVPEYSAIYVGPASGFERARIVELAA